MTDAKPARAPAKATDAKPPADKVANGQNVTEPKADADKRKTLKWTVDGQKDEKNRVPQHAEAANGDTYRIVGSGDEWKAILTTKSGKEVVLAEDAAPYGHARAYQECVKHHGGKVDAKVSA